MNGPFPTKDVPSYVTLLPHHSVDPEGHVVLLADNGDGIPDALGLVWRLRPVDTESRTDADVGALAARIDNVLASLPDGTSCQFLLRSSKNLRSKLDAWEATTRTEDPVLQQLASSRRAALEKLSLPASATVFEARTLDVLFTLVRPGTWPATQVTPLEALRTATGQASAPAARLAEAYLADRKKLLELARTVESLLAQAGVGFERLDAEGVAAELYRALNPVRCRTIPVPAAEPDELLRERAAQGSLAVDLDEGIVFTDDTHHKIVSVTTLPGATRAGMLMRHAHAATLLDVAPEVDLILNVHVCDQEEMRARFGARRRMATDQSRDAHQSPTMAPHLDELVALERELAGGARVASVRLHAIARGRTAAEAADRARAIQAALATAGFRAIVEDVLAGTLFLQSLPLAYRPDNDAALRRGRQALSLNVAHLVPVYGTFTGTASPTQILLNRRGEPIFISFFNAKEAPHAIVTGKSGAGKSVFANDLILNALRGGGRVWVLDRGASYRKIAEIVGGTYVNYDAKNPSRLNPCGIAEADGACPAETNNFLRDWLCEMVTHGKDDLPPRDRGLLSLAVRQAFASKPAREIVLSDVHAALERLATQHPVAKDLALCLTDYVGDGPYARFFDGANEINFEAPFVALDLADAALEEAVTSVLVMGIMHQIAVAAKRWLTADKYLIIDEAWTLLKSAATARFIENIARTARKARLSLVILSQQLTDLEGASGRAILGQTSYKVCLHQDADAIRQASELLGLNAREAQLYTSLRTAPGVYSELLIKTPFGSGVARLLMDALAYWMTTSDMADRAILDQFVERAQARGLQGREALRAALIEASMRYPRGAPVADAR